MNSRVFTRRNNNITLSFEDTDNHPYLFDTVLMNNINISYDIEFNGIKFKFLANMIKINDIDSILSKIAELANRVILQWNSCNGMFNDRPCKLKIKDDRLNINLHSTKNLEYTTISCNTKYLFDYDKSSGL